MPKSLGRGRSKGRGHTPAGEELAAWLLGRYHSGAVKGGKQHGEVLRRGDVRGEENKLRKGGPRSRVGSPAAEGRAIARGQEPGPPAEGPASGVP